MAILGPVQWDVRTGGSDTNGGGFDPTSGVPGTDYSQQNSPQVTYTDLVIGATNTQLTSAGNPFTSAHVGNIINVTGGTGFTTGRYQVISVTGSTATMDRAVGTASSTGGAGNLGGSMATMIAAMNASVPSNTVWVQSGTYTQTTSGLMNNASFTGANILNCTGYGTTHGDNGTAPLLTTATNSVDLVRINNTNTSTALFVFTNLSFSNTASVRGNGLQEYTGGTSQSLAVYNCTFTGLLNAINGDNGGAHGIWNSVAVFATEIANSTGQAIVVVGRTLCVAGSYIHGGGSDAISGMLLGSITNSIIAGNSGYGIVTINAGGVSALFAVQNSVFVANTSGGINIVTLNTLYVFSIENTIFCNNGGYGINCVATPTTPVVNNNNAYGSNTSGARHNFPVGINDVTLTANPFTASGSGDYSLNSTSGGGAACKGAAYPGVFPGGASTGHLDIGAVQSSGGGGGSTGASFTFAA